MSGPNADTFQRALKRFKRSISPDLANQFSLCTLKDVREACRDIQQKHGEEGKLRNMRRLEAFIEAMEQFGKVIEVFVNASELVCFLWGPVKFILNIARTHLDSFDKLLDVYAQVGEAIPGLLRYQTTFEKHPPLAAVLEDYYSDILEFHQAALYVFKRPKWKEMFHSTWKTFDSKFRPIIHSLRSRRELLESEKGSATLYEIHKVRQDISVMQEEQKQSMTEERVEKHKARVFSIRGKLQAPNYQIDQEIATEDRQGYDSGVWIFGDPNFRAWSRNEASDHNVLYVNGIPGAGKTTLMSTVIEKLLDLKRSGVDKSCIAYFYFKHKEPNKETYNGLLRAILDQLVDEDPEISDRLFPDTSPVEGTGLRSTKTLEKLVKLALESYQISYIVLDGLDECAPGEAAKSVKWFLSLADGGFENNTAVLRVLFCGQRDGVLDKMLANRPSISLETSAHVEDINRYCRDFCQRIREKFDIPPKMEDDIVSRVTNGAQGMFLYARIVLGNLLGQTKLSGLRQEIEPGTFPQGIEKAYERVAVRVFEKSSPAERDDATRILSWITCARRLLRWREIQSLFCIDPLTGNVDYEGGSLRVTCKDLCGSLVDVHHANVQKAGPEDIIRIVHETAREYLIRRRWLNTYHDHARLAIFCSRYLTSKPFALGIDEEDITAYAIKGYYGLQDYAAQNWFDHFRECLDGATKMDPGLFKEAMESVKDFFTSYGLASRIKHDSLGEQDEVARTLKELPQDGNERNAYFSIEFRTASIRKKIEAIQEQLLDPAVQEIMANLHGTTALFKCSKPWCEFFTVGFESIADRQRHADRHDLPFSCSIEDCFGSRLGYDSQSKLHKHMKRYHPEPDDGLEFPKVANKNNKNASIWVAIVKGDLTTVKALLDSGTDIEKTQHGVGHSPLYLAAESGYFEICKLLVDRGAVVAKKGKSGYSFGLTALHAAVSAGDVDIVRLLVNKQCPPDDTDRYGRSPFCEACALGHLAIVKVLFETGHIQVDRRPSRHPEGCKNKESSELSTPLGYACTEGHLAVVQYLLQQNQPGLFQEDILDCLVRAVDQGHWAIVDLLLIESVPSLLKSSPDSLLMAIAKSPESTLTAMKQSPNSFLPAIMESPGLLLPEIANSPKLLLLAIEKSPDLLLPLAGETVPPHLLLSAIQESPSLLLQAIEQLPVLLPKIKEWPNNVLLLTIETSFDLFLPTIKKSPEVLLPVISRSPTLMHKLNSERLPGHVKVKNDWFVIFDQHVPRMLDIELVHTLNTKNPIWTVKLSQCGTYIAIGCLATIHVYMTASGMQVCELRHERPPTCISFGPHGKHLAIGTADGHLGVWDIKAQEIDSIFKDGHSTIYTLDFSQDGRIIASGSSNGIVRLWDVEQRSNMHTFDNLSYFVTSIAISPDTKLVAAISVDATLCIWDVHTGSLLQRLSLSRNHEASEYSITFSPDRNLLVSHTSGTTMQMLESLTGNSMGTFGKHGNPVVSAAITPDANWILSGSRDCSVQFWDRRTGSFQLMLHGHNGPVSYLATSPTENLFVTGSRDGRVCIWSYLLGDNYGD
ncbi:hypothetical protein F4818DRAFT_417845 [Hypoxylon cercidicola]|nr:hypothetical protein F4818DRAFT_417845 [Hypoxylon cercidicola]